MRRIFAALSLLYAALGSHYVLESSLEYPETIQALTVLAWAPALVAFLLVCPWLGRRRWSDSLPAVNWVALVPCLASMAFFYMLMSDMVSPSFCRSDVEEHLAAGLFIAPMAAMLVAVTYVFSLGMVHLFRWVKKNR